MFQNNNPTEKRMTNYNSSRRLENKEKNDRGSHGCITTNKRGEANFFGDGNQNRAKLLS